MTRLRQREPARSLGSVLLLMAAALVCGETTSQPADHDSRVATLLREADQHQQRSDYYHQTRSLEEAIGLMKQDDPQRYPAIGRLIDAYRAGMGQSAPAEPWIRLLADELRPKPEGIDALLAWASFQLNHGHPDEAYKVYREVLDRIMAPDPPYDRYDRRCLKGWNGEKLCKFATGCDPLFPSDLNVVGDLNRFIQLVRTGNWHEAGTLLDQNLPLRTVVQEKDGPRTWISVRQWLARAINGLPADSVSRLEATGKKTISDLVERRDWRALAVFRLQHPLPAIEQQLDIEIGHQLLDQGMPGLASLFYGSAIRNRRGDLPPLLLARELFCRLHAGERVRSDDIPDVEIELAGERRPLRQWAELWQSRDATDEPAGRQIDIDHATVSCLPLMRSQRILRELQLKWLARHTIEVPDWDDEFITTIPVGSPRCVLANVGDGIQAVDVIDGRTLWTFDAPEENSMTFPNQKWTDKKRFIECARARSAVVQGDYVYCHLAWGHHDTHRQAGGLFALRRSDGAMIWSSLQIPELAGLDIAADPAVDRGVAVAVAWRPREAIPLFYLVGIAAETGDALWINHLYSGSPLTDRDDSYFLDRPLACGPPVIADGVAYFSTGAGVIGAASVIDGTLLWAIEYPRVKAIDSNRLDNRAALSRPAGIIAVCDEIVLFAPIDSHMLLAVDRTTGELRYSEELLDLRAIAAVDDKRAYIQDGTTLRAIIPADGSTVWKQTLPASRIVGVATLGEHGLLCPTWDELFILAPDSGRIVSRRPWRRDQACSYLLDFGDRLVGVSRRGLVLLADEPLNEMGDWWLPSSGGRTPAELSVPSRANKWLRWAMPAVNRGDFVLSDSDREHVLIRSDLLQMRRIDPVPALVWQRSSPLSCDYEAIFDQRGVALWDRSSLIMLDANTGETRWQISLPLNQSDAIREVILAGEAVYCISAGDVRRLDARTGEERWSARPEGSIRGICLCNDGVGVYTAANGSREDLTAHLAILLDPVNGNEVGRFDIPRPPPSPPLPSPSPPPRAKMTRRRQPPPIVELPPLIVARSGLRDGAPIPAFVLVDGRLPVHIDWTHRTAVAGDPIAPLNLTQTYEARLEVYDNHIALSGRYVPRRDRDEVAGRCRFPLVAVWDRQKLSRINVPPAGTWCIGRDNLYTFSKHRIRCLCLSDSQQQWESLALMDQVRLIMPTEDRLLVLTEGGRIIATDLPDVSHVRLFDIHTGERTKDIRLPKVWVHYLDYKADRLMMWDCAFLYDVETPRNNQPPDRSTVRLAGKVVDADAIGSLKLAADLEDPVDMKIQPASPAPVIDGNLSDWSMTEGRRLETHLDFRPDFAHRNRVKPRMYGGVEDLSAVVRIAEVAATFCLAVEVTDDLHVASMAPGLWRSDSVTFLMAEDNKPEVDPTMFTAALVGGVMKLEVGSAVSAVAVSNHADNESTAGPEPVRFVLPQLHDTAAPLVPPGATIDLAIRRDESSHRTVYELRIPKPVLVRGSNLYWDVFVHENDGHGREGALQLGSAGWGIEETAIGSIQSAD